MMGAFLRFSAGFAAFLLVVWGLTTRDEQADRLWLLCLAGVGVLLAVALWPSQTRNLPVFGRTMLRWTTLICVAFLLVSLQLVRVQIVESGRTLDRVVTTPDGDVVMDPRRRLADVDRNRGRILDAEGRILAETLLTETGWQRVWPEPSTWGLTGYYSPLLYGATNLEAAFDSYLSGRRGGSAAREWLDGLLNVERPGYDVRLSIDLDLQRQATDLLAGRQGAVVLLDADTGAVLALAGGGPDPNRLYASEGMPTDDDFASVRAYWQELTTDSRAPLVFRPTQGLYTPGSTFKTVTVAAAIDAGVADPGKVYDDAGIFEVDGRVIEERNRPDESKVRWTLEESYAYSLNIVFAQVGLNDLGPDVLWEYASRFGFGDEIPFDLPTAETQLVGSRVDLGNRALLADTAFGQGEILASPLQMAMVVAAVVNDGVMMRPWVGEVALDEQGNVIERFEHGEWRRVISGDSAATVRALMLASVAYGYASAAAIPGATVGGKTGTAEVGEGEPHAWFTGFAEANGRRLVVAIVVEHGGAGSQTALPIGRTLLASALGLEP